MICRKNLFSLHNINAKKRKKMTSELLEIKRLAKEKQHENENFSVYVKKFASKEIDSIAFAISEEITAEIDCTKCGNCCKVLEPPVNQEDITFFAKKMNLSEADFEHSFIKETYDKKEKFLCVQPCIMLLENKCTIYENRPNPCADYPHLHHGAIKYRMKSILRNYGVCPIVFRTIEKLKIALDFGGGGEITS